MLRVRGVFGCDDTACSSVVTHNSTVALARLGQSLGYEEMKWIQNKWWFVSLTGKTAESGGVSIVVLLLEFVNEDCCQTEELLEFNIVVSFVISSRVI